MNEVVSLWGAQGQTQCKNGTISVRDAKGWAVPLSFQSFQERVTLLAELELPCVFYLGAPSYDRIRSGIIRKIERRADRLSLLGGDFALFLHRRNIDSIWLVQRDEAGDKALAVEIYGRNGEIIARILGLADSLGYAVWHDVMGNPSLAIA
ncbi:hypothetical protein [Methylococcus sp. EFPC2]|uniref:hypothetical protein n=1 Tax=Methylococcus sp. EFPC2 TaxID=2812648 RepID=UPI0019671B5D|nr:hypothetical protein [Methylococcus sp. EFPC2]QSA96637.1 hypothetical protein JWZ97_15665 [Methylococcus sp. EFPC2]